MVRPAEGALLWSDQQVAPTELHASPRLSLFHFYKHFKFHTSHLGKNENLKFSSHLIVTMIVYVILPHAKCVGICFLKH